MRSTVAITKKEILAYINSPIAYVFVIIFLGLCGVLFVNNLFLINQADMRGYFALLPIIFLFFIPALTMRLWAEEKKLGTFELLLTLPVQSHEAVLGKFFASLLLVITALVLSLPIPIGISMFLVAEASSGLDWGAVMGSYIGSVFLAAAYLSIGIFFSSLTENQIIAFILAVFVSALAILIGEPTIIGAMDYILPESLGPIFEYVGLRGHFDSIARGVLDSRDVLYYISFSFFFLMLTGMIVEHRRK
ncbi:MAG: ABC transporter permease subunit [Planctomycetota bacterium]|nr:ABC transporter permease subunit [Planctomycetota bacterium]